MYGEGNPETPWKDSLSHLSCISRIFRPECSFDRKESRIPVYRLPIFPSRSPAPGKRNGFCRFVKNMITHRKSTDTIPCSMSPHSRTTSSRRLQDFPVCSALTPDSERPAILTGTDDHPCFCAALPAVFMQKSCEYQFLVHRHSQLFIHTEYFYFFVKA